MSLDVTIKRIDRELLNSMTLPQAVGHSNDVIIDITSYRFNELKPHLNLSEKEYSEGLCYRILTEQIVDKMPDVFIVVPVGESPYDYKTYLKKRMAMGEMFSLCLWW